VVRTVRVVGLLLLVGEAARGEVPTAPQSDPRLIAARGHFDAGRVYFEQGDFKRALREFLEAARDVDLPALDFNIARAHDRLGDAVRAVERYQRYLTRAPDQEDRAQIVARIRELQELIGTLVIVSRVPGAVLVLDEEAAQAGVPIRVTAGAHKLVASREGWLSRTVEVRVAGGQEARVEIDPAPVPQAVAPPPRIVEVRSERPSRWWIGVVVGAVVLAAAAGATAAGVVLAPATETGRVNGNVDPGFIRVAP